MVTAESYFQFTVFYLEPGALSRILDMLARYGLEPAWLFSRSAGRKFKLDVRVTGLCDQRAALLAARIGVLPTVAKVKYGMADRAKVRSNPDNLSVKYG